MILSLNKVNSFYGDSQILFDLSLEVEEGDSVCILGRNGVGKSTTMKTIIGQMNSKNHASYNGEIIFDGNSLAKVPPYKIIRSGISYVPQGRHIFPTLTTLENLLVSDTSKKKDKQWTLDKIYELFPRLKERESILGSRLSGGEQQMLAIARGLIQNPKLLLLDEITEGLAPIVVDELATVIAKLREEGVSIFTAEQNVKFALKVSRYCYIIEKGTVVYHGESSSIPSEIIEKYLGM